MPSAQSGPTNVASLGNGKAAPVIAPTCCTAEETVRAKAKSQPVLLYSNLDADAAAQAAKPKDASHVCVYGMNFGQTRGVSTLAISGVQAAGYDSWHDPGAPYSPGHYAEICAQVGRLTEPGALKLQVTTPLGASNTLAIDLPGDYRAAMKIRSAGAFTLATR